MQIWMQVHARLLRLSRIRRVSRTTASKHMSAYLKSGKRLVVRPSRELQQACGTEAAWTFSSIRAATWKSTRTMGNRAALACVMWSGCRRAGSVFNFLSRGRALFRLRCGLDSIPWMLAGADGFRVSSLPRRRSTTCPWWRGGRIKVAIHADMQKRRKAYVLSHLEPSQILQFKADRQQSQHCPLDSVQAD